MTDTSRSIVKIMSHFEITFFYRGVAYQMMISLVSNVMATCVKTCGGYQVSYGYVSKTTYGIHDSILKISQLTKHSKLYSIILLV